MDCMLLLQLLARKYRISMVFITFWHGLARGRGYPYAAGGGQFEVGNKRTAPAGVQVR